MTTSSIGTSGRTYSTIAAWLAACPANITAAGTNEIWKGELYNDSEFLVTSGDLMAVTGITTDATHYIWLTTATGQSFRDNGGATTLPLTYDQSKGVGLRTTNSYGKGIDCGSIYVLVENVQLYHDVGVSGGNPTVSGQNLTCKNCIFQTRKTSVFSGGSALGTLINCVIALIGTTWTGNAITGGWEIYNCTIVRPSDLTAGGSGVSVNVYASPSGPLIKNSVVMGAFTTPFAGTLANYQAGTGYNAGDVASGSMPGSNNVASLTFANQFEGVTNAARDWRPKSGNGLAAGTRDATNTGDLDIIGAARSTSTPMIGAREITGGGGGLTVNATPANAVASGVTAAISRARTINATPANAVATGVQATIVRGSPSFVTPALANNSGVPGVRSSVAVHWYWFPLARVDELADVVMVHDDGTTEADGTFILTEDMAGGTGAGFLIIGERGASASLDRIFGGPGTIA